MIDCHTHLGSSSECTRMLEIADVCGHEKIGVVCTISEQNVNANSPAFVCKRMYPERTYIMCGLDHSEKLSNGEVKTPSLADQVDILIGLGADGIKMIEGKPTTRRYLDIPVDDEYFDAYFKKLEETSFPVLWHVNDPEEFWDPAKIPDWASERNWGYDETDTQWEEQYAEVDRVLAKYPGLHIIFAHFYFFSADLERAAKLFDTYENIHFDLAPGIEMLYNTSKDVSSSRDFFCNYSDRIVYGTDIFSSLENRPALARCGIVKQWLETDREFRVPAEADFLLGKADDGIIKGMSLPEEILDRICSANYMKLAGNTPSQFDPAKAAEECRRIASGCSDPGEALSCADQLSR